MARPKPHMSLRVAEVGADPETHKLCLVCDQAKLFSEFSPQTNAYGGVASVCKPCAAKWQREFRRKYR